MLTDWSLAELISPNLVISFVTTCDDFDLGGCSIFLDNILIPLQKALILKGSRRLL